MADIAKKLSSTILPALAILSLTFTACSNESDDEFEDTVADNSASFEDKTLTLSGQTFDFSEEKASEKDIEFMQKYLADRNIR